MDLKLEVVRIPVADVDRAKRFYEQQLGWRLDADFVISPEIRAVQFTPPGSAASIHFGKGIAPRAPGPIQDLYLVVSDIEAARADLVRRGVAVSEIFHQCARRPAGFPGRIRSAGATRPTRRSATPTGTRICSRRSSSACRDADGKAAPWNQTMAETTTPNPDTTELLTDLLKRTATAHGVHEKELGKPDPDWPHGTRLHGPHPARGGVSHQPRRAPPPPPSASASRICSGRPWS